MPGLQEKVPPDGHLGNLEKRLFTREVSLFLLFVSLNDSPNICIFFSIRAWMNGASPDCISSSTKAKDSRYKQKEAIAHVKVERRWPLI